MKRPHGRIVPLLILVAIAFFFALPTGLFGANPVQLENAKAGTSSWNLTNPATSREIEGYASLTSVNRGGQISLYVNTSAKTYTIEVFRMGWYAGFGGRQVLPPVTRTGVQQVIPAPDSATGLVECNWTSPYVLAIPNTADATDWCSGVYLAKLTASSGKQSYIIFAVRDDARPSSLLQQCSFTTYQAYNPWGGKSLYSWNSTNRVPAVKVSFNRPYAVSPYGPAAYGVGAGEFLTNVQPGPVTYGPSAAGLGYNMVRWLEREGYDVTYCTNIDTGADASLLRSHKGFLSVGHDEYWSWEMRANVEAARDAGVGLGFFSSNTCYWQVRFENSGTGQPDRTMVSYKDSWAQDPYAKDKISANNYLITRLWRDNSAKPPEEAFIGVMYQTDPVDTDIVIEDSSSWVCAGTGLRAGDHLVGLLGYEADGMFGNSPAGTARIAHSPYANNTAFSDMTVYTAASGATVFATGSMQWVYGLDDYNAPALRPVLSSEAAKQMTRNVLASILGNRPAGTPEPPLASWTDNFDDNSRNASLWRFGTIQGTLYEGAGAWDATMPVVERNQRLEITTRASTTNDHYNGYVSTYSWDMTGAAASIEVRQVAAIGHADTQMALCADSRNFLMFIVEGGILYTDVTVDGARGTSAGIPYNAIQHRFWRIRHIAATDLIQYETSPDGTTWNLQRSIARPFSISSLRIELSAGTFEPESAAATAIFDNFRFDRTPVTPWTDNFDDNSRNSILWSYGTVQGAINSGPAAWDATMPVLERNQRLEITTRAAVTGAHYNGYVSTNGWDLTGMAASVEVRQVATIGSADTEMALCKDSKNFFMFVVEAGILYSEAAINGERTSSAGVAYNAVQHRLWRIRHVAANDAIQFETSPDGVAWTLQRSIVRPFPITSMKIELSAGTWQSESVATTAIFDNFQFDRLAVGSLADNFDDNSRNIALWSYGTIQGAINSGPAAWDATMPVLEQNQRLEITTRAAVTGAHYNGYVSTNGWNLTGAAASVELRQVAAIGYADTQMALCIDSRNFMMFVVEGGVLYSEVAINGVRTATTSISYNAVQHRFLRIRHVAATDLIQYETSPDGTTWTVQRSITRPFSITAMKVELSAGTWRSESAVATAIFDNFRLAR